MSESRQDPVDVDTLLDACEEKKDPVDLDAMLEACRAKKDPVDADALLRACKEKWTKMAADTEANQKVVAAATESESVEALDQYLESFGVDNSSAGNEERAPGEMLPCTKCIQNVQDDTVKCKAECEALSSAYSKEVSKLLDKIVVEFDPDQEKAKLEKDSEEASKDLEKTTSFQLRIFNSEEDRDEVLKDAKAEGRAWCSVAKEVSQMDKDEKERITNEEWPIKKGEDSKACVEKLLRDGGTPAHYNAIHNLGCQEQQVEQKAEEIQRKDQEAKKMVSDLEADIADLDAKRIQVCKERLDCEAEVARDAENFIICQRELEAAHDKLQKSNAQLAKKEIQWQLLDHCRDDSVMELEKAHKAEQQRGPITEEFVGQAKKIVNQMRNERKAADCQVAQRFQKPYKERCLREAKARKVAQKELARKERHLRNAELAKMRCESERRVLEEKKKQKRFHALKDEEKKLGEKIDALRLDVAGLKESLETCQQQRKDLEDFGARTLGEGASDVEALAEESVLRVYGDDELVEQEFEDEEDDDDPQGSAANLYALAKPSELAAQQKKLEEMRQQFQQAFDQQASDHRMEMLQMQDEMQKQFQEAKEQWAKEKEELQKHRLEESELQKLRQLLPADAGEGSPKGSLSPFTMLDRPTFTGAAAGETLEADETCAGQEVETDATGTAAPSQSSREAEHEESKVEEEEEPEINFYPDA